MRYWLAWVMVGMACGGELAAGRDIFVSNGGGNDRHDGRAMTETVSGGGAVRTISKALRLAKAGDRIVLENTGEPYREALSLMGGRHSGAVTGPLVIDGRGAVLDGTTPIPADAWQHFSGDVFAYRPARLGYQQLFLDGKAAVRHPTNKEALQPPPLAPREWCLWRGQILFRVDEGSLPDAYVPSCCGLQTGITLYYVHNVLIRDLVVQGFAVDGVAIHDVVRDTRLERVVSRDNGMSGVSARGASWAELDNCMLVGNGLSQLRIENFARCWVYRGERSPETAPAVQLLGGQLFESREPFSRSLP
jgi:hypothetical protein